MNISAKIQKFMADKKVGVNELSRLAGVASATVTNLSENTKFVNVLKMLKALGYTLEIKREKSNAKPRNKATESDMGG